MPVIRVGQTVYRGRALDLRDRDLSATTVRNAITASSDEKVQITCPAPGSVYEYVGFLTSGRSYALCTALAKTARECGHTAPQDETITLLTEKIRELDDPAPDYRAERRRLAGIDEPTAMTEQLANLRGQVQVMRERGEDPDQIVTQREELATERAEIRTRHIAAQQARDQARQATKAGRDQRERRLSLQDRRDNLRREARKHLAETIATEFADALAAVPGSGAIADRPWQVTGEDLTAALAIARLAPIQAPLVLATDRFLSARAARECLGAPVILVSPDQ